MSLNINGDQSDASYRYKMPKMTTKVEGRGNGIRTVILNNGAIADSLHVHPVYQSQFFGVELGARSKWEKVTNRAVVAGQHSQSELQKHLFVFINKFIMCPNCNLPELKYKYKKTDVLFGCNACGHSGSLDPAHKLTQYMVKHPPKSLGVKGSTKGASKKDVKKLKKEQRAAEKAQQATQEERAAAAASASPVEEKEVVWHTDTSTAAVEARKNEEMESMSSGKSIDQIMQAEALAKAESPSAILKNFVKSHAGDTAAILGEVRRLQMARGFDATKRCKILFEALLDEQADIKDFVPLLKQYAHLLQHFTTSENLAQIFIGCLEEVIGVHRPELTKRSAIIFHCLYDEEIVEEEHIMAWFKKAPEQSWIVGKDVASRIKKQTQKFIDFLAQESDSEEESSSDEDED